MPTYDCPECKARVKLAQEVGPGKKIRCPACKNVFAPAGVPAAAAPKPKAAAVPKPAPAPAPAPAAQPAAYQYHEEVEDDAKYDIAAEKVETEEEKERKKISFTGVKDKFKKSARGPAMETITLPSRWLLRSGIVMAAVCFFMVCASAFPLIFREREISASKDPNQLNQVKIGDFKPITVEMRNRAIVNILMYSAGVAYACFVVVGATKMQTLDSYAWAWVGAVMAALGSIPLTIWGVFMNIYLVEFAAGEGMEALSGTTGAGPGGGLFGAGVWNIWTLSKEHVKAGFLEQRDFE